MHQYMVIYRLLSTSLVSTPDIDKKAVDKLFTSDTLDGAGGLITLIFKQQTYTGLISKPIKRCKGRGKKLAKAKHSELSPEPFGWR